MEQAMKAVEISELAIAEVDGQKYRLVPLVVRGPERRRKDQDGYSVGAAATVSLSGVIDEHGSVVVDSGSNVLGERIALLFEGKMLVRVDGSAVSRVERRSGKDRRKL